MQKHFSALRRRLFLSFLGVSSYSSFVNSVSNSLKFLRSLLGAWQGLFGISQNCMFRWSLVVLFFWNCETLVSSPLWKLLGSFLAIGIILESFRKVVGDSHELSYSSVGWPNGNVTFKHKRVYCSQKEVVLGVLLDVGTLSYWFSLRLVLAWRVQLPALVICRN